MSFRAPTAKPKILITGARGGLAQILSTLLKDEYQVFGADPRALEAGHEFVGELIEVDYTHRKMTELFRAHRFEAVLHLGRVRTTADMSRQMRYNLNVLGTRNVLELSLRYGVKRVLVFSTFHVYGASSQNHLHITEGEPLRATQTFPELGDAVELDHFSMTFLLQHPEMILTILRPCNVIGAHINNEISLILRQERCPTLMGYDPMLQFVDERDLARAILLTLKAEKSGVYNITGEGVVPYSHAIRHAGSRSFPVPTTIAYPLVRAMNQLGVTRVPHHLMDFIRYPVILSDDLFRAHFGYTPQINTVDALRSLRRPGRTLIEEATRSS